MYFVYIDRFLDIVCMSFSLLLSNGSFSLFFYRFCFRLYIVFFYLMDPFLCVVFIDCFLHFCCHHFVFVIFFFFVLRFVFFILCLEIVVLQEKWDGVASGSEKVL